MVAPVVLTGGESAGGTGIDNTQTDFFLVSGTGNTVAEPTGNLDLSGSTGGRGNPLPADTQTSVYFGGYEVTDDIALNGSYNNIQGGTVTGIPLSNSTVDVSVSGIGGSAGHNTVQIANYEGTNTVALGLPFAWVGNDSVVLSGADSADTVNLYSTGGDTVTVGYFDDDDWGSTATITLNGSGSTVSVGDATANVSDYGYRGRLSNSTITVGDANNTVSVSGGSNTINVGGGSNTVTATGGGNIVNIDDSDNAEDGLNTPTDVVVIGGAGNTVEDTANGTGTEDVFVEGNGATGSTVTLGNGDNSVWLGGDGNTVSFGNGFNSATFTGNGNTVTVTDAVGVGDETIHFGNGTGDSVSLDYAGGKIVGTGTGTTTVTQNTSATADVKVKLGVGTGDVTLGNGKDKVIATGNGSQVTVGNGNDLITVGGGATVQAGDGNDTITTGDNAHITAGKGNDTVTTGNNSTVTVGNGNDSITAGTGATVTAGSGNDSISVGNGSTVALAGSPTSHSSVSLSSNSSLTVANGGQDQIAGVASDNLALNGLTTGSNVFLSGNGNDAQFGNDSSGVLTLNHAGTGNTVTIQADSGGYDSGNLTLINFNNSDALDLQGLIGAVDHNLINSVAELVDNLTNSGFGQVLHVAGASGNGSVLFEGITALQLDTNIVYSGSTGLVSNPSV
jgi:hypothetical protein